MKSFIYIICVTKTKERRGIMKYYVVSDIHSFYNEFIISLTEKGFFKDKGEHKLIICGDLFDRGLQAKELQDFIIDLIKKDEVILIRGNHEDLLIELVNNLSYWINPNLMYTHHWRNGTVSTLLQLSDMNLMEVFANSDECQKRMKESPFFNLIVPRLKNFYETKNYIFVHGWIPCFLMGEGIKDSDIFIYEDDWRNASFSKWNKARWINGLLAAYKGIIVKDKTIVCGHWHSSFGHATYEGKGSEFGKSAIFEPYFNKGIIAIDACTAYSKKVNCIVIDDEPLY